MIFPFFVSSLAFKVSLACLGGLLAFAGLWMEHRNPEALFSNIRAMRRYEWKAKWGWRVLMVGIGIETIVAGWASFDEWKDDPWNGFISEISARAFFEVRGDSVADIKQWGSPLRVASLKLCENNLEATFGASHFAPLDAEKFDRGGAVLIGDDTVRKASYSLTFQWSAQEAMFAGFETPVKEIAKVKIVRMDLKFLQKNSEILGGNIKVVVNGRIEILFQILPQIDTNGADVGRGIPYTAFATNVEFLPKK